MGLGLNRETYLTKACICLPKDDWLKVWKHQNSQMFIFAARNWRECPWKNGWKEVFLMLPCFVFFLNSVQDLFLLEPMSSWQFCFWLEAEQFTLADVQLELRPAPRNFQSCSMEKFIQGYLLLIVCYQNRRWIVDRCLLYVCSHMQIYGSSRILTSKVPGKALLPTIRPKPENGGFPHGGLRILASDGNLIFRFQLYPAI